MRRNTSFALIHLGCSFTQPHRISLKSLEALNRDDVWRPSLSVCLTCSVWLAVVLSAVLHLDWGKAEGLDHLVGALAPIGGAEGQNRQGQSQ